MAEQQSVCCSRRMAHTHTAGECVCVCSSRAGGGLWEAAIRASAVPPVKQVDARPPALAGRHLVKVTFPKSR